jgi:hypothetical protein
MLLYADGNLMQVLEGEKNLVLETYQAIQSDPRHRDLFVLIEEDISSRQFDSWSMGFRQLSKADLKKFPAAANIFQANKEELLLRGRAGDALTVLKSFAYGALSIT